MEPESDSTKFERAKRHLKEHRKKYLIGAGCLGVGYLLRGAQIRMVTPAVINTINNAPVIKIANTASNGGHMRKIVRCLETGDLWLSVTEAAKAQGKNISLMSQHLNHPDVVPDINGLHFVIEALTTG